MTSTSTPSPTIVRAYAFKNGRQVAYLAAEPLQCGAFMTPMANDGRADFIEFHTACPFTGRFRLNFYCGHNIPARQMIEDES